MGGKVSTVELIDQQGPAYRCIYKKKQDMSSSKNLSILKKYFFNSISLLRQTKTIDLVNSV